MPTLHQSTMSRERAIFNYDIHKEFKFNVGRIKHECILKAMDAKYHRGLINYGTITKLFKLARVPINKDEEKCSGKNDMKIPKAPQPP